jgi:hypothetical protein
VLDCETDQYFKVVGFLAVMTTGRIQLLAPQRLRERWNGKIKKNLRQLSKHLQSTLIEVLRTPKYISPVSVFSHRRCIAYHFINMSTDQH